MIENDCFKELGYRLSSRKVAKMLKLDIKTVIKHYAAIGGMRLGRNILFFEKKIVQALERGVNHALPTGQEMDRAGYTSGTAERESAQFEKGSVNLGERTKVSPVKRILKADTHGIFSG